MSLYIPGLAAPKDGCKSCMFDVYGQCLIKANLDKPWEVTHSCPLIEVPPHGRVGDPDALRAEFPMPSNWNNANEVLCHITGIWAEIDAAPTIIPADGADKEEPCS